MSPRRWTVVATLVLPGIALLATFPLWPARLLEHEDAVTRVAVAWFAGTLAAILMMSAAFAWAYWHSQ